MTIRINTTAVLPLLLVSLSACGGGPPVKAAYGPPPRSFEGFQASKATKVAEGQAFVNVEASFVNNHKRMLGTDLTEKGILPIRLILGLRGDSMKNAQIKLNSDQMEMRLYLSNGNVLVPVGAEELEKAAGKTNYAKKVIPHALKDSLVRDWDSAAPEELFVFFKVDLKDAQLDGSKLSFLQGGQSQIVDITKSLVTFNLLIENKPQPFAIGIQNR